MTSQERAAYVSSPVLEAFNRTPIEPLPSSFSPSSPTMAANILDACTARVATSANPECPTALTHIHGTITHPLYGELATVSGTMVNRNVLRGTFLQILDGESDELHQFSQKLFDKNGFLKPELIEHDYHRGTGCWGEEVNDGLLVYIDTIEVNKNVRSNLEFSDQLLTYLNHSFTGLVSAAGPCSSS